MQYQSTLSQFALALNMLFQQEYARDKRGALCQLVENGSYYLVEAMVTRPDSKEQPQQYD